MINRYSSFAFGISRVTACIQGSFSFEIQGRLSYFIKKLLLPFLLAALLLVLDFDVKAQTYHALDYYHNGNVLSGVKIRTNIPFLSGKAMPTIHIEGYSYGTQEPIELTLVWYIYNNDFVQYAISSSGAYTPPVYLSNEGGLVTIFIDDTPYFQRFEITAYEKGITGDDPAWFDGWTAVDDTLGGTNQKLVPYVNNFAGTVSLSGKLVVNDGNILIGKTTQSNGAYRLDVNGSVRANKVVVNTTGADFVFDSTYQLHSLKELETYIQQHHHLPDVSSSTDMQSKGMDVGAIQTKLLQKIEELTLYLIKEHKENQELQQRISTLESKLLKGKN